MSKKLIGAICACTMMICGSTCAIGYVVASSIFPWWLLVFMGGVACAIISMIGEIIREKNKEKRAKKLIGCICASINMLSVLTFLALLLLTKVQHSWIVVMVGAIVSAAIYLLYDATKGKK